MHCLIGEIRYILLVKNYFFIVIDIKHIFYIIQILFISYLFKYRINYHFHSLYRILPSAFYSIMSFFFKVYITDLIFYIIIKVLMDEA